MAKSKPKAITPNQQKALIYLRELAAVKQSPTIRQLADYMGWSAVSTAADLLDSMQRDKLIHRKKFTRKIKILAGA